MVEGGFIIFLFYSNLLMGEFERSGMGQKNGVAWALGDVFTAANFEIAEPLVNSRLGVECDNFASACLKSLEIS